MMSEQMRQALNEQIQAELYSAYLYLAMSLYFESQNLPGFAHWMWKQYLEEQEHAHKFIRHLIVRGQAVILKDIPAPKQAWASPTQVFQEALAHEQEITRRIRALYHLALQEQEYPTLPLLQWFLEEQNEEEDTVRRILEDLRRAGDDPAALLMLDRELGQRQ